MSAYEKPGIVLDARNITVNPTDRHLSPYGTYDLLREAVVQYLVSTYYVRQIMKCTVCYVTVSTIWSGRRRAGKGRLGFQRGGLQF